MSVTVRKICVVTGSRAEYGLLFWLLKEIQSDPTLTLQLVVTGSHLEKEFGQTVDLIVSDGFPIAERVQISLQDDSPTGISKSMGLCITGMTRTLEQLNPDILVVLGDRFEVFAAVQAAMLTRVPIAHIHGGETTEYAIDEAMRHAITKMSHLHFAAADAYANRIIQMGEQPDRVFTTGAIGLDHFTRMTPLTRLDLENHLDMSLDGPVFIVTYHPVTLSSSDPGIPVSKLVAALAAFPKAKIIITSVNADTGHTSVKHVLEKFARENPDHVRLISSLGSQRYLSLMRLADAVIGNSSSGLIEAPAAGVPSVNIGKRQEGRLRASSVIDCEESFQAIKDAINLATQPSFKKTVKATNSPYFADNASQNIAAVLRDFNLDDVLFKHFYDLDLPV